MAGHEDEKLKLEERRVAIEERKLQFEERFFHKHIGAMVTAAVSLAAVFVSLSQVWIAGIGKDKELELFQQQKNKELEQLKIDNEREWKLDTLNFVARNRDRIFSENLDERRQIRNVMVATLPREITGPLFGRLAALSLGGEGSIWNEELQAFATESRRALERKVADADVTAADLQLFFDENRPFAASYSLSAPDDEFLTMDRFQAGITAVNNAMSAYAQYLVDLAGGGRGFDLLARKAELEEFAQDLDANIRIAAAALGLATERGDEVLFGVEAIQFFGAYVESGQRDKLVKAMSEMQPGIENFSTACQLAVSFLANVIKTQYTQKFLTQVLADPRNATPILALNDATVVRLATLQLVSLNYGELPKAHRKLFDVANGDLTSHEGRNALREEATRFQDLVRRTVRGE